MINKKIILMSISLVYLMSCQTNTNQEKKLKTENENAILNVDSATAKRYEDITRWRIYCFSCDNKAGGDSNISYGMLPLILQKIKKNNDTIEVIMRFNASDSILDKKIFPEGIVYKYPTDSILFYSFYGGEVSRYMVKCMEPNCPNRIANPLQPEVIKYIRENKDKIDPWFYQEAKKRGVFDSSVK